MNVTKLMNISLVKFTQRQLHHARYTVSTYRIKNYSFTTKHQFNFLPAEVDNKYSWTCRKCGYASKPVKDLIGTENVSLTTRRDLSQQSNTSNTENEPEKPLGLFARFKLMYRQYWYVLIPVHVVTSVGWLGGFYYLSKSGVDIPALLQSLHLSEAIIDKLRDSEMGHLAISYLCYKVATPLRYMVTLGGTTISIKYLEKTGLIKPMPTKIQLIQMYEENKANRARRKQEQSQEIKK